MLDKEYLVPNQHALEKGAENLADLGLECEDLEGRKVLDIGSGSCKIGEYLEAKGVDCTSLDKYFPSLMLWASEKVNADVKAMPFADESFDVVISEMGPPMLAGLGRTIEDFDDQFFREQLKKQIEEIKRVLKPGGEFRIFPDVLQYLANKAYVEVSESGDDSDERYLQEIDKAAQKSIALYNQFGLKGIIKEASKTGKKYLVWEKPLQE